MKRQSNMEALRIVSMLMVLSLHFNMGSVGVPAIHDFVAGEPRAVWQVTAESLSVIGVNCFVLISGYFGIHTRLASIVKFLATVMLYSCGVYVIGTLSLMPDHLHWEGVARSLMVISVPELWFVPCYFILMLLAPFINAGASILPKGRLGAIIGALVFFDIWSGWCWDNFHTHGGYSPVHLIVIYLIGRWIGLHYNTMTSPLRQRIVFSYIWILSVVCITCGFGVTGMDIFSYNSPFVISASVAFFMIFRTFSFHSNAVNTLAAGAFSVYLIHHAKPIFGNFLKPFVCRMWDAVDLLEYTLLISGFMIMVYLVCWMIDSIRRTLFSAISRSRAQLSSVRPSDTVSSGEI